MHSADQPGALRTHSIHLPAPTAWPFLMALGLTLVFAALVTSAWSGGAGRILTVVSIVGWFREVLPHEAHEDVAVTDEVVVIVPSREKVARIDVGETHRAQLPLETFPISSGIMGGIAGGIAMVIPAEIYGIVRFHSIWYVVNLLGGAGVGGWVNPTVEADEPFPAERVCDREHHSGRDDAAGWFAVRSDAADMAEASDFAGRDSCTGGVDGTAYTACWGL